MTESSRPLDGPSSRPIRVVEAEEVAGVQGRGKVEVEEAVGIDGRAGDAVPGGQVEGMFEDPIGKGIRPLHGNAAVVAGTGAKDFEHGRRGVQEGAEGEIEFQVEKRKTTIPTLMNFDGQLVGAIEQHGGGHGEDIHGGVGPGSAIVDDVGEGQVRKYYTSRWLRQIDAGQKLAVEPNDGGVVTGEGERGEIEIAERSGEGGAEIERRNGSAIEIGRNQTADIRVTKT